VPVGKSLRQTWFTTTSKVAHGTGSQPEANLQKTQRPSSSKYALNEDATPRRAGADRARAGTRAERLTAPDSSYLLVHHQGINSRQAVSRSVSLVDLAASGRLYGP